MRTKRNGVIAAVVLAVLLTFALLYVNNRAILLRFHGFDRDETLVAYSDADPNGEMFEVVVGHTPGGDIQIGHIIKNKLGLWRMEVVDRSSEGWSQHVWSTTLQGSFPTAFRVHFLHAADNAVCRIESIDEYLPEGLTAEIFQPEDTGFFWIHVYDDGVTTFNGLNIQSILRQAGYIADK